VGVRSGSNVGLGKQLDRGEPLGTGKTCEPAVFPNRRLDCTHFFVSFNQNNAVLLIFIFFEKMKQKTYLDFYLDTLLFSLCCI
jgi:hypothetical protein